MSVLDQLEMTDTGDVEVRIIPPDSLSPLPDALGSYRSGTHVWELICHSYLRAIAEGLGIQGDIVRIVHGGGDRYTVLTSDGDFREIDIASNQPVLAAIKRLSDLVEALEMVPHNKLSSTMQAPPANRFHVRVNSIARITTHWPQVLLCVYRLFSASPATSFLPGQLNVSSKGVPPRRATYQEPNIIEGRA